MTDTSATMLTDLLAITQVFGSICQMSTAIVAVGIAVITFRYTKRQSALALVNQNNSLANLVNTTLIQSEAARNTFAQLQQPIVGCPEDAVLFMYLNYVHNTFRMRQIGAVSHQVWQDTLASCACRLGGLRRDQVDLLLARGYERAFQSEVLTRFDMLQTARARDSTTTLRLVA